MINMKSLKGLGRQLDIKVIKAKTMKGMYYRLNQLQELSGHEWATLRGTVWVGENIVMFMVRPRKDSAAYNDEDFPGECTNSKG